MKRRPSFQQGCRNASHSSGERSVALHNAPIQHAIHDGGLSAPTTCIQKISAAACSCDVAGDPVVHAFLVLVCGNQPMSIGVALRSVLLVFALGDGSSLRSSRAVWYRAFGIRPEAAVVHQPVQLHEEMGTGSCGVVGTCVKVRLGHALAVAVVQGAWMRRQAVLKNHHKEVPDLEVRVRGHCVQKRCVPVGVAGRRDEIFVVACFAVRVRTTQQHVVAGRTGCCTEQYTYVVVLTLAGCQPVHAAKLLFFGLPGGPSRRCRFPLVMGRKLLVRQSMADLFRACSFAVKAILEVLGQMGRRRPFFQLRTNGLLQIVGVVDVVG